MTHKWILFTIDYKIEILSPWDHETISWWVGGESFLVNQETMRYSIVTMRILMVNKKTYPPPTTRSSRGLMVNNHHETMRYVMVTMRILMVSWWWLVWIFTFCYCLRPCVSFSQPIRSLDDTHLELRHNWLQNSNNFTMRPRDYLVVGGGLFFVWLWDHEIYHSYHENSHGEQKKLPPSHTTSSSRGLMVKNHDETMRYLISTMRILIIKARKYTPPTMRGSHGLVVTIRIFTARYLMVTTWYLVVSLLLQRVHVKIC